MTATLALQYQPGERWSIEGVAVAVAAQDRVSSVSRVQGDSYQLFDLLASWQINDRASLRAGLFNVFDTEYARWSSIKGLSAADATAIANAQAPGSSVRIGLDIQF